MHSGAVQKRRRGGEGGGEHGDRKGGIQEIERSDGMWGGRRERETEREATRTELKVSVRTEPSSELDRETVAVTSVLISPSAG